MHRLIGRWDAARPTGLSRPGPRTPQAVFAVGCGVLGLLFALLGQRVWRAFLALSALFTTGGIAAWSGAPFIGPSPAPAPPRGTVCGFGRLGLSRGRDRTTGHPSRLPPWVPLGAPPKHLQSRRSKVVRPSRHRRSSARLHPYLLELHLHLPNLQPCAICPICNPAFAQSAPLCI